MTKTGLITIIGYLGLMASFSSCSENQKIEKQNAPLFQNISSSQSSITFSNNITETDTLNYFQFPYMYMGGGVAVADFDNDGLQDLYFTGNMVPNSLYQNKGNFQFEDRSSSSGLVGRTDKWYTGVSVVDINDDGWKDIYLSVSGIGEDRRNELYINKGDWTFEEKAEEYGLADSQNTVQAVFLDYDHDGDLDCYVVNYPITPFSTSNEHYQYFKHRPDSAKSDHLFRNEGNNQFVDVTKEAGLLDFGLSLSAMAVDFNQDGWEDIYVSNDFSTPDLFYINNGDGTFREVVKNATKQISFYGMGTDAADINNDGLIDLMQVDMSSENNRRQKANMASMNPDLFWSTVNSGFHYQYMYNSLQINQGLVDGLPIFSNAAWISGVSSTDWSWSPLFADFDNDGYKDLFITNGTRKEINNRDYFKKIKGKTAEASGQELKKMADEIPSEPIDNYIFRNKAGEGFEKKNEEWNVSFEGFSNGAAYADLDNDGDLELIISNIDAEAKIWKNNSVENQQGNYLRVKLSAKGNADGEGAEVHLYTGGQEQIAQVQPVRGFQSTVESTLHFGLGEKQTVDSLLVLYQNKVIQKQKAVAANQELTISLDQPGKGERQIANPAPLLKDKTSELLAAEHYHQENGFNDFNFQVLLPHKMSNFGPALATADINGDGFTDMYVGAATGDLGSIYYGSETGFSSPEVLKESNPWFEDLDAMFFDADNDGDQDLYIVSGGNAYPHGHASYQDRLFLNENGMLKEATQLLPRIISSGSCVRPFDYDGDGDLDLFVGARHRAHQYPYAAPSYLLENQMEAGSLSFIDVTQEKAEDFSNLGMVTDAVWTDLNGDQKQDLLVVGEWMPITAYVQTDMGFENQTEQILPAETMGWWFALEQADIDGDGDQDFLLGNLGKNYKYQASEDAPFAIYAADFDENKKSDIVLSYHSQGEEYPVRGRQCSSEQIPAIQVVYEDYESFSVATVQDIYGEESLDKSYHFEVTDFSSVYMENTGEGFELKSLPLKTQMAPINDFLVQDFNQDGNLDVALVGGLYAAEVETPRNDSSIGWVMMGDGQGNFEVMTMTESGMFVPHDAKKIKVLDKNRFVTASNKGPLQIFVW